MSKAQSAGVILLVIHIGLHLAGFYAWLSQPTYDVFVMTGKSGYVVMKVRIDAKDVAIRQDSSFTLHRGMGEDVIVQNADRAEIVTVNVPVWAKIFGYE